MPGRNGTGLYGAGPLTGSGLGLRTGMCIGLAAFSYIYPGPGFALWANKERWIGRIPWIENLLDEQTTGSGAYADTFKKQADEKEYLTKAADILKMRLQEINNRLKEIEESISK